MIYRDGTPVPPRPMHLVKPPSRLVVASPSAFADDPTVLSEFIKTQHEYYTERHDPSLTIRQLPQECAMNLDRFRAEAEQRIEKEVSLNLVHHYCLSYGLVWFRDETAVSKGVKLKKQFQVIRSTTDKELSNVINGLFAGNKISIPQGNRKNFTISQELRNSLSSICNYLTLSISEFSTLCIMRALSEAESTIEGHAQEMSELVSSFLKRLEIKNSCISILLKSELFEKD